MRYVDCLFFFFNDTATTEIYTLSLHDALPISDDQLRGDAADDVEHPGEHHAVVPAAVQVEPRAVEDQRVDDAAAAPGVRPRSEEHTSELQSRQYLVCRLLLEKKKNIKQTLIYV